MAGLANLKPWQPGQSGNPKGRPIGSRHKLEEAFLADLAKDWSENGAEAVAAAREKDPMGYVKTVASLMPKQVEAVAEDSLTRAELEQFIAALRSHLNAGEVGGRVVSSQSHGPADGLPAISKAG